MPYSQSNCLQQSAPELQAQDDSEQEQDQLSFDMLRDAIQQLTGLGPGTHCEILSEGWCDAVARGCCLFAFTAARLLMLLGSEKGTAKPATRCTTAEPWQVRPLHGWRKPGPYY